MNKIALRASNGKRLQTRDGVISYSYGTCAGRVCKTEFIEYKKKYEKLSIIINFDDVTGENRKEHNPH